MARRLVLTLVVGLERASTRRLVVKAGSCLSVGRDPGNAIRLNILTVSRWHAKLDFRGERCVLSDAGSSGGLYVNGQRRDVHALQDGDRLQLGAFTLEAAYEESDDDVDDQHQELTIPLRPAPAPPAPAPSNPEPIADAEVDAPVEAGAPRPVVTVAPNPDPAGLQRVVGLGLWPRERLLHALEAELAARGVAFEHVDAAPGSLERAVLLLGDGPRSGSAAELLARWPALTPALLPRTVLFEAHPFHAWALVRELDLAGAYTVGRWELLGRAEVQARLWPDEPLEHGPKADGRLDPRFARLGRGRRPDPVKTLVAYLVALDAFRRGASPGASPR